MCSCLVPTAATAQNVDGVVTPFVDAGHEAVQYRGGHSIDPDVTVHRLQYEKSIDDDRMWRLLTVGRETGAGSLEYSFLQGELFWQLDNIAENWAQGVRFDVRVAARGGPGGLGINWMHQYQLAERWAARVSLTSSVQVGDGAADGVFLQSRAFLGYQATANAHLRLSLFSRYGSTDDLPGFAEQTHQLGPTLDLRLNDRWQMLVGYLAGLTDATTDSDVRLWLTHSF